MNILIVTGNPKEENHSRTLAETYKAVATNGGHEVKIIDVYASEYRMNYSRGAKLPEGDKNIPLIKASQDLISWAEEIVFIHPVWWSSLPGGLKNWIDSVFVPGFAYKYVNGRPEKLLTSKKAKVFATAGSYAPYYLFPIIRLFTPLHLLWKFAMLGFFGIDLIDFKVCDKMNVNNSCPPEGHFETFTLGALSFLLLRSHLFA
jgi:NAD(P)H dehydrogenase (quinone)